MLKKKKLGWLILLINCKEYRGKQVVFTACLNGYSQGPALEIALSCNYIKADANTSLNFNYAKREQIPFFGQFKEF